MGSHGLGKGLSELRRLTELCLEHAEQDLKNLT